MIWVAGWACCHGPSTARPRVNRKTARIYAGEDAEIEEGCIRPRAQAGPEVEEHSQEWLCHDDAEVSWL
jgi:hypothetical protein